MSRFRSKFRLTVPQDFFDLVSEAAGQPFADSYLYGAQIAGGKLTPRTACGFGLMRENRDFMNFLATQNLALAKPLPFYQSGNPHTAADPY